MRGMLQALWTESKPQNACPRDNQLLGAAIVLRNIGILNQTRRNIDLINLGPFGQAAHQIHHVQGLTSGISIIYDRFCGYLQHFSK